MRFILKISCQFILLASIWSGSTVLAIETNFPDLGEHSERVISLRTEQLVGDMIMQNIQGSNFAIVDPIVNQYLQGLALKFNTYAHITDFKLDFFGVNTPELNAFAFFGGHVAVHSGLILAVDNESELAAVLAHETAHITQHHLARILASSRKMMPITFAEILAAVAIGALGSPDAGVHLATAAMAGHVQKMINFTREHEQEADRIGIQLLSQTQYDPSAMASVFQRMKQDSFYRETPPEYLLTHPIFDSRIADAQNRAEKFSYRQAPDSLYFHLVRARLEINKEENGTRKTARLKEKLSSGRYQNKTAAEYAYALSLLNNHKAKEALPILQDLTQRFPNQWILELGLAEAESANGQGQLALNRCKKLLQNQPNNYAIILEYANFLLQNKQPVPVIKLLMAHRREHIKDPILHQMLARAYSINHQPELLHRAQAEWHFTRGEFKEALQQLDLALEYAENNQQAIVQIKDRKESMKKIRDAQRGLRL